MIGFVSQVIRSAEAHQLYIAFMTTILQFGRELEAATADLIKREGLRQQFSGYFPEACFRV